MYGAHSYCYFKNLITSEANTVKIAEHVYIFSTPLLLLKGYKNTILSTRGLEACLKLISFVLSHFLGKESGKL